MRRRIKIRAAVHEIREVAQHQKAVGEPRGNPQHVMVFIGQRDARPSTECRRAAPDIDGDVEHRAGDHADQFSLGVLNLVMQPAQSVFGGAAVVVLHKLRVASGGGKLALLPGLEEKSACIAEDSWTNEYDIRDCGGLKLHVRPDRARSGAGMLRSRSWQAAAPGARAAERQCSRSGKRFPPGSRPEAPDGSRSPQ